MKKNYQNIRKTSYKFVYINRKLNFFIKFPGKMSSAETFEDENEKKNKQTSLLTNSLPLNFNRITDFEVIIEHWIELNFGKNPNSVILRLCGSNEEF